MRLSMQGSSGTPETLPDGDNEVDTGAMGDCVSLVLLWNRQDGLYQHVRGYHGYGGFGAINLRDLLNGVPNDSDTLVIACFGSLSSSSAGSRDPERVREALQQDLGSATVQMFENQGSYTVSRDGSCR